MKDDSVFDPTKEYGMTFTLEGEDSDRKWRNLAKYEAREVIPRGNKVDIGFSLGYGENLQKIYTVFWKYPVDSLGYIPYLNTLEEVEL